jgi:hypothetical protein
MGGFPFGGRTFLWTFFGCGGKERGGFGVNLQMRRGFYGMGSLRICCLNVVLSQCVFSKKFCEGRDHQRKRSLEICAL